MGHMISRRLGSLQDGIKVRGLPQQAQFALKFHSFEAVRALTSGRTESSCSYILYSFSLGMGLETCKYIWVRDSSPPDELRLGEAY